MKTRVPTEADLQALRPAAVAEFDAVAHHRKACDDQQAADMQRWAWEDRMRKMRSAFAEGTILSEYAKGFLVGLAIVLIYAVAMAMSGGPRP